MHRFSRWKLPLSEAQTVGDVLALMDEYLKTIPPTEIERLPADTWDALGTSDIAGSALVLVRGELHYTGDPEISAILHEIAHTFVAASTRIASIQARGQPVGTTTLP